MNRPTNTLFHWIWPGGLILALDFAALAWWRDLPWFVPGVTRYGWVVLASAALLAWRFSRSRVAAIAIGLTFLWLFAEGPRSVDAAGPWEAMGVSALMVVGLMSITRDRGVFSPLGVLHPVVLVLAGFGALQFASLQPEWFAWLDAPLPRGVGPHPAPGLVLVLLGALVPSLIQAARLEHPVERGLSWTLVGVFLVFASEPGSLEAHAHATAVGLVLLLSLVETSYALAYKDDLTGLPTRRALRQAFDGAGQLYTVAMVDVDHFKRFNDRHGHDVGDQVLKMVAVQLAKVTGGGKVFRYGGEEFTVLFPGKARDDAIDHLERLRARIEGSRFTVRRFGRPRRKPPSKSGRKSRTPRKLSVTVSIGVAERSDRTRDPGAVIKAADEALYRAKRAGRNRLAK